MCIQTDKLKKKSLYVYFYQIIEYFILLQYVSFSLRSDPVALCQFEAGLWIH